MQSCVALLAAASEDGKDEISTAALLSLGSRALYTDSNCRVGPNSATMSGGSMLLLFQTFLCFLFFLLFWF